MSFVSGLPAHPSLEQLHKRAKELLHQLRAGDLAALDRVRLGKPRLAGPPKSSLCPTPNLFLPASTVLRVGPR